MAAPARRRLLILTKRYPPHGSPGAQRMHSFARHLPEFGWEARVVTPKREALAPRGGAAAPGSEGRAVEKTGFWDYRILEGRIAKRMRGGGAGSARRGPLVSLLRGMNRLVKEFLLIPDKDILWAPFGVWSGIKVVRRERIDGILATAPPHSVTMVGLILSLVSRKPLVVDFRDPWVGESNYLKGGRFKRFVERRLEGLVVRRARLITMTTRSQVRDLVGRRPAAAARCIDLPNGIEETWERAPGPRPAEPGRVCILHSGQIYRDLRNPGSFFRALADLLRAVPDLRGRMKVTFAGPGGYAGTEEFAAGIRDNGLQEVVEVIDWLPQPELTQRVLAADVLLLLQNSELARTQLPSKVFHYAWSGRPILALAPAGSETAEFVRQEALGVVAEVDDPRVIGERLREVLDLRGRFRSTFDPERFSRRSICARLAGRLEQIAPPQSGRSS